MYFTKSSAERVTRTLAVIAIAIAPLLAIPVAGDPYQPVRAVVLAVAMTLVLVFARMRSVTEPLVRAAVWAVGAYVAFIALSAMVNGLPSAVWGVYGRYIGLVATLLFVVAGAAGYASLGGSMRLLGRVLALSVMLQSALMLVQLVRGTPVNGSLGNAALAGQWLCVAAAVVAGAALGERGRWRWFEIAATVAGVLALGASGSRAAWVGIAATLVVLVVLGGLRARLSVALMIAGLLLGVAVGGAAVSGKLSPGDLDSGSAAARLEIWRGSAAMIVERPLLGVGIGRFVFEFPRYESPRRAALESGDTRADVSHSRLLQAGADGGVIAAIALLVAWASAVITGWRCARKGDAIALAATAGLIAFGVQGVFGISTVETDALGWLLGGIAIARLQSGAPVVTSRGVESWRLAFVAAGTAAALLSIYYLANDVRFERGRAEFERADFAHAGSDIRAAIRANPLVDTYRVALADVASYETATGSDSTVISVLGVLDDGIAQEPDDYDLHASKARLLALGGAGYIDEAAAAFRAAMALYPHGAAIRQQYLSFARASGDPILIQEALDALRSLDNASRAQGGQ